MRHPTKVSPATEGGAATPWHQTGSPLASTPAPSRTTPSVTSPATPRWRMRAQRMSPNTPASVTPIAPTTAITPGGIASIAARVEMGLPQEAGVATGELVLRVADAHEVHVPWAVAVPARAVDLISRLTLKTTSARVSDATPAALSLVAGAVTGSPQPQVRAVDELDVQLWRGDTLIGVLARRRELLPGRYTFGLTGRGPEGERLRRGRYLIRVVARPGDGTRRQVESIEYVVR